jgi:hypothetical protein
MKERRKFPRTTLPRKGKFFGAKGWEECTVTEASRTGLSVKFYTREKINVGSIMHLKILFPSQPYPVEIKGLLKWIKKEGKHFIGGIEWFQIERGERKEVLTNLQHYSVLLPKGGDGFE